jgi:hypothetical protein
LEDSVFGRDNSKQKHHKIEKEMEKEVEKEMVEEKK